MSKRRIPSVGELRQSQVVTTFGPGAMLGDLPCRLVRRVQGEERALLAEQSPAALGR